MKNFRVLLIDDEEELVSTLVERLEFRGIEAEAVTSGQEALDRLDQKTFQVAVVDLKMPGVSGLDVLNTIRRKHPDTRVLLITGHGAAMGPTEEMPEGSSDILLKPFSIDTLIERINQALGP